MDTPKPRDLTHYDDAVGAVEMALELNKVKTVEASKKSVQIDEKFTGSQSPESPDSDQTRGPGALIYRDAYGGKQLITVAQCKEDLASNYSERKKWMTLFIVWLVQISMNFNCSLYSNAIPGMAKEFDRSQDAARWGASVFLIAYAFGCELWAPWSEELGRFWVLEASLFLVNLCQFGVGFANNLETVIAFRTLGGLSTAGGSITLGMVADMWDKEHHQIPVAFVVFASVGGSVLGPIFGGFIEANTSWKWAIWLQLLFGAFVQLMHYLLVSETRATIIMDRCAKSKRKDAKEKGEDLNLFGPNEVTPFAVRFSWAEIFSTWLRPFKMFITEPIVLALSMLSGFSDALIFMFVQCFGLVYRQWSFTPTLIGLCFLPFLIGYIIAWISFIPAIARNRKERDNNPGSERAQFESRLWLLLYLAPCLPIGLFGFAWTSGGPPIHWIGSMVFTTLCGIANYAIYMATIDYMVTAYGPYSASATGGNGWARDFLAGILTPIALPYYNIHLGPKHIELASTILGGVATILVGCVFVIYKYGPWLRHKSKFAQKLDVANRHPETAGVVGIDYIPSGFGTAPASRRPSRDNLAGTTHGTCTAFHPLLNRTISHSTPNLHSPPYTTRAGFSRPVTPNRSRGCSRNTSPSDRSKKRPLPGSRSRSLYNDKARAEREVTIDHPALVRSSGSKTPSPTGSPTAAAAAPAPSTGNTQSMTQAQPPKLNISIPDTGNAPVDPAGPLRGSFDNTTVAATTAAPPMFSIDWSLPPTLSTPTLPPPETVGSDFQSLSSLALSGVRAGRDERPVNAVQVRQGRAASVPAAVAASTPATTTTTTATTTANARGSKEESATTHESNKKDEDSVEKEERERADRGYAWGGDSH